MDISIFGLGYVGSVSAAFLADKGHRVFGVDTNKTKVEMMNTGKPPIIEPGLHELTASAVAKGNLRASCDYRAAILETELSFICVGTPSQTNHGLDLKYVRRVCEDIGHALKEKRGFHTLVFRSTMFPGSMKNVVIPTIEKFSEKKAGKDFSICINPEFMKEGSAVHDFANPPKNIVGAKDQHAFDLLTALNDACTNMPTICLDIETAEFVKYCDNIWHALKVAFANEIGNVCKVLNIDSHKVMDVFCKDTKLNLSPYYLKPGFAFGGSCLPKDLRAFLHETKKLHLELPVLNAILPSNHLQIEKALKMIIAQGHKRIGILGFSFKANTDDLRESPIVELAERLIGKGYELVLFDKNVSEALSQGVNRDYLLNQIPHISKLMVATMDEVVNRANTIVIGNHAKEFEMLSEQIPHDRIIIDLVRVWDKLPSLTHYHGICW